MKFSELREADLSKAQIKKVHDKADDLPKSDFIKRYGKEGDAVRFATATNIVKKQLGIGEGFKSDAQRKAAFASGYKEKGKNKKEELDKEDEKTVGDVVKQLKKAVKAHQSQVDTLTKDIKEEVEITEGRVILALDKKTKKKWQFSGGMTVKFNGKQYKTEGVASQQVLELTASFGSLKLGKKDIEDGFASGTFSVVNDGSVYQPWKNDFEPEGEQKLTEAVSDAYVKQIARMTDRNDHFGARVELARMMKDKELMKMYDSLEKMHSMNLGGNDALTLRSKLDKNLKFRLTQKFKTDANKLMDAL
jgi:hypothetical protein